MADKEAAPQEALDPKTARMKEIEDIKNSPVNDGPPLNESIKRPRTFGDRTRWTTTTKWPNTLKR